MNDDDYHTSKMPWDDFIDSSKYEHIVCKRTLTRYRLLREGYIKSELIEKCNNI